MNCISGKVVFQNFLECGIRKLEVLTRQAGAFHLCPKEANG